jgi:DNA-binding XRE family transcriptional regulator
MSEPKAHRVRGALELRAWRLKTYPLITQAEMGARIGVDLPRYNAYENGRARPGLDCAVKIEHETGGRVQIESWTIDVPEREWDAKAKELSVAQEIAKAS